MRLIIVKRGRLSTFTTLQAEFAHLPEVQVILGPAACAGSTPDRPARGRRAPGRRAPASGAGELDGVPSRHGACRANGLIRLSRTSRLRRDAACLARLARWRGSRVSAGVRLAVVVCTLVVSGAGAASAQDATPGPENPLAVLHDELKAALAASGRPFTAEQERAITLMMEERQRASEDLFGDLMDFRSGPTSGREADRLRSAIAWMRAEFLGRVEGYLTDEQRGIWRRVRESEKPLEGQARRRSRSRRSPKPSSSGSTTTRLPPRTTSIGAVAAAPRSSRGAAPARSTGTRRSC